MFGRSRSKYAKKAPRYIKKRVPKKIKNYVKREIHRNIEDKTIVVNGQKGSHASPWADDTLYVVPLACLIQQGDDGKTRSGTEVKITGIEINFSLGKYFDQANTEYLGFRPDDSFRIMMIKDKDPDGDIVDEDYLFAPSGPTMSYVNCPLNNNFKSKYHVLYDKKIMLHNSDFYNYVPTTADYYSTIKTFRKYLHFKRPITVTYKTNTGAIGDIIKNEIEFVMIWNGLNVASDHFMPHYLDYVIQLHFEDA